MDENILYVDTQEAMHGREHFGELYREDGFHVNDAGHAVLANILAERVVSGLPGIESRVRRITRAADLGR